MSNPEPEWTSGDSAVPLVDFELPRTAGLDIQKKTSILGISRTRHHTQEAVILTSKSNRNYVLTALHELSTDADSSPTVTLQLRTAATSAIFDFSKDNVKSFGDGGWIAIPQTDNQTLGYPETRFRVASEPEELCVTRTVGTIDRPTDLVQTIDAAQMIKTEFGWLIQNETSMWMAGLQPSRLHNGWPDCWCTRAASRRPHHRTDPEIPQ